MPEEVAAVPQVAVERSQRDFPRRDAQQQGSRRRPPRPHPPDAALAPAPGDDPPLVGSRLNVRA
jgi:hypothetical protein